MRRPHELVNGKIYHVMNKSIAGFTIFHSQADYNRMLDMIRFFSYEGPLPKFSKFRSKKGVQQHGFAAYAMREIQNQKLVDIISYCLMPTHIHLALRQNLEGGISTYMGNLLNTYARYFNIKRKRQGRLWMGPFKNVEVVSDEQLLHLTRYHHLNPSTAGLVKRPENWVFSSYNEYLKPATVDFPLCKFDDLLNIEPKEYQALTNDQKDFQRELAKIKHL